MTLPGLALDADPRFPFYGIRHEIERVTEGEGSRIDTYLQLKTVPETSMKGKIIIDSPGFDADSQRDTVLRIADHIIGMSDLILVFFDARHPEPGAMRDTLKHLVEQTRHRHDADKFLFILNQIDTAANEDNPEDIMGSWQRALASSGMAGGKFYMIYNEDVAVKINDPNLAERFKRKKDADLAAIQERMDRVSIERAYRISFALETLSDQIEKEWVAKIDKVRLDWAKKVAVSDLTLASVVLTFSGWLAMTTDVFSSLELQSLAEDPTLGVSVALLGVVVLLTPHYYFRSWWAKRIHARLLAQPEQENLARAFSRNTVFWRSMFAKYPRGWSDSVARRLNNIREGARSSIQKLNDQFVHVSEMGNKQRK
jgi:hypothetical protein